MVEELTLADRLTHEELTRVREWCASREADKPWYSEFGDSPKLLTKCDFMVALIDEVLTLRASKEP